MKTVLITGSAGFIGFHLSKRLLVNGFVVVGYDGMTDYYDVNLKKTRHQLLDAYDHFHLYEGVLEDEEAVKRVFDTHEADVVIHLAAQAGVRYGLENPRAYIESNIIGTFNILEQVRVHKPEHFLMASTSSIYGANENIPFSERHKADHPLSIYAATKKADEAIVHSYAHLHKIPSTMLRFFTVYGPYGRPDMALFKFVDAILKGRPIDVYNQGQMKRDFTYVADIVRAIHLLIDKIPDHNQKEHKLASDVISEQAPYRTVNIGNGAPVNLMDFIREIEKQLGQEARCTMLPMQNGDVPLTYANCDLLHELTGFRPETPLSIGVKNFVDWYRDYYDI